MTRPNEPDDVRDMWNRVARDWDRQVGDDGDANRRLNSDPVLWEFLGPVDGLRVLDAGCGTGYLSRLLAAAGARVTGVDLSPAMIEIAREKAPDLDHRVDSCSTLSTLEDGSFDRLVANYVLMDTPDLDGALAAFARVLTPGGVAVVIFSHPCFPQSRGEEDPETGSIRYAWAYSYFESSRQVDPPWGHFDAEFIWFHRPLSDYWRAYKKAGFAVVDFDEPHLGADTVVEAGDERMARNSRTRPYSVAFKLERL